MNPGRPLCTAGEIAERRLAAGGDCSDPHLHDHQPNDPTGGDQSTYPSDRNCFFTAASSAGSSFTSGGGAGASEAYDRMR